MPNQSGSWARIFCASFLCALTMQNFARAAETSYTQAIRDAQALFRSGEYARAARFAYAATDGLPDDSPLRGEAHSWVAVSLAKLGMENASAYFFVRTLQSGNRQAIRRALSLSQDLMVAIGPDVLRKYMIRHTRYEDYEPGPRNAFLYTLAKEALLTSQFDKVVGYVNSIGTRNPLWPFAVQIRATASAIQNKSEDAIRDFRACAQRASEIVDSARTEQRQKRQRREARDLEARCLAGEARTLYQMGKFEEAERAYDAIPKSSIIWPDLLFEQAWNAYGKGEFNRSLGKLVSYKSPALRFVFNTEVEVLAAQSYLQLCLYGDANEVINDFNARYQSIGEDVKHFVEGNSGNLGAFFDLGKRVARGPLTQPLNAAGDMNRVVNRFVRSPYFQELISAESDANQEATAIQQLGSDTGLAGFLRQVLAWRQKTIRQLGGAFVKNSLLDYHSQLLADFDKMSFIKLEMLKRAKDKLIYKRATAGDRSRGNKEPKRRNDQYYWSFNGEFWNDELGDYIFGLESECTENEDASG